MEEKNSRSLGIVWIVVIYAGVALLIIGLALAIWLGYRYFSNKIGATENSASTSEQTTVPSAATQAQIIPTESPI